MVGIPMFWLECSSCDTKITAAKRIKTSWHVSYFRMIHNA